ncbi:expressed unknown protein [Seminavis robusta]|uniref:Uncharacterized protein n=1 Tax=Seminavis robusta TaxID=568900 RepID=A0A9N8ER53_9STRA|nr:expressed unknown protein [Seminavis robusta]|eukprot:Sro1437_g272490.1 n/a (179) ;mRNA; r:4066-4602
MASRPDSKRKREGGDVDPESVAEEASELRHDQLLELAQMGIRHCPRVCKHAAKLLKKQSNRRLHCVRCHEDYDPNYAGNKDCKFDVHDESEGMINIGRGPDGGFDRFQWPGCENIEDEDEDPCFEGSHISDWSQGGDYWMDEHMEKGTPLPGENDDDDDDDSINWCSKCGKRHYYNGM